MDELLTKRYADQLDGVLSCYDRIVISDSLQPFCYAQGMARYLYQQGIRILDTVPLNALARDERTRKTKQQAPCPPIRQKKHRIKIARQHLHRVLAEITELIRKDRVGGGERDPTGQFTDFGLFLVGQAAINRLELVVLVFTH